MTNFENWDTIPAKQLNEFAKRQVFAGENLMLVMNTLEPGLPDFPHSHPHEQLLFIIEGECELTVGEDVLQLRAGSVVQVPSNVMHNMRVTGDKRVLNLDVFYPIREDYLG